MREVKRYISIIVLAVLFVIAVSGAVMVIVKNFQQIDRLKNNNEALLSETLILKAENGNLAHQNKVIQLSLKEAKDIVIPELQAELKNLNIKLKRIESFSQTSIVISDTISIALHDTIIVIDSVKLYTKSFSYTDKFASIKGNVYNDSIKLDYSITDTIVQFVHRGKYNNWYDPLLFRKRPLVQTITAKNPKTHIHYARVIKVQQERW